MPLANSPSSFMANVANGTSHKIVHQPYTSKTQALPKSNLRNSTLATNENEESSRSFHSGHGMSAMNAMSSQFSFEEAVQKDMSELKSRLERLEVHMQRKVPVTSDSDFAKNGFSLLSDSGEQERHPESFITENNQTASWMPVAIRKLPVLGETKLGQKPLERQVMTAFPEHFITSTLGGKEWSPGLWYTLDKNKNLPSKTYYLLSADLQPYLPKHPGEHGAMLTVFFHDFDKEQGQHNDVPLFVCMNNETNERGEKLYNYLGTYTQFRWSDKLDYDHVVDVVPESVKKHWAKHLVRSGREQWETEALQEHFVSKPTYIGEVPKTKDFECSAIEEDMKDFLDDMIDWEQESMDAVNSLTEAKILEAFEKEDASEVPGLRFWWEYLQCVGFDRNFYYELATALKSDDSSGSIFGGPGKE